MWLLAHWRSWQLELAAWECVPRQTLQYSVLCVVCWAAGTQLPLKGGKCDGIWSAGMRDSTSPGVQGGICSGTA